ncbi:MAG: isoprenyl transferase [Firmicutes bacterium]|nr:isoprenyl transferase [Bacillota bacterium]
MTFSEAPIPIISPGQLASRTMPHHVAIIMDGNGRWAQEHGLHRSLGHREGAKALKPIVKESLALGIQALTVYAFSTENWRRPAAEVDILMDLLVEFLQAETPELKQEGVHIRTIGHIAALPLHVQNALAEAEKQTRPNSRLILNLALNYGGRDEIIRAMERWLAEKGESSVQRLSVEQFSQYLDTAGLPDLDLLIRTSGEMRVSNFLLWQLAYAEIFITHTLWPDFSPNELRYAIYCFQNRQRRFGGR